MTIIEELDSLRSDVLDAIAKAQDTSALEDIRVATLGKSGTLTAYLRSMGSVPKEQKAEVGRAVNETREAVEGALDTAKAQLAAQELAASIASDAVDVTLPGRAQQIGTRHLINAMIDEVSQIFLGLG